jgi:hypothetical protein
MLEVEQMVDVNGGNKHHEKSQKFIWIYMPHTLGKKVYQNKCSRDGLIWSGYYV